MCDALDGTGDITETNEGGRVQLSLPVVDAELMSKEYLITVAESITKWVAVQDCFARVDAMRESYMS